MDAQTLEALWGHPVADADRVDERFVPKGDEPFTAAVIAAQGGLVELTLHGLFGGVLAGTQSDGAGDVYCLAFQPGAARPAIVEWHHDEPMQWSAAAPDADTLDAMLALLEELDELDADPDELVRVLDDAGGGDRDELLAAIEDEAVREVLSRWPAASPPPSFDFGTWREVLEMLPADAPAPDVAAAAIARLKRSAWVAEALASGRADQAPPLTTITATIDEALAATPLAPGDALYALWATWLCGRDALPLCARFAESPSALVRSAVAALRRAMEGNAQLGTTDVAAVREALVARSRPKTGDLTEEELERRRALIRTVRLPRLTEWSPALASYAGVEVLETAIGGQVPPALTTLRTLRRFSCNGRLPDDVSPLTALEALRCIDLPASATALTRLRELHLTAWQSVPVDLLAQLTALEDLTIVTSVDIELPASWGALRALRRLDLTGAAVRLPDAIASLPALETLTVRGKLAAIPADWSGATALREVTFRDLPPDNLAALTSAPALRSLVLEPYTFTAVPDLFGFRLDSLQLTGNVDDVEAAARRLAAVPGLRRLVYRGNAKGRPPLPEALVGLGVEELHLSVPLDPPWPRVAAVLRGAPALRSFTLHAIAPGAEPVDTGAWPQLEALDLSAGAVPTNLFANAAALPALRTLTLGNDAGAFIPPRDAGAFLDGLASCRALEVARLAGVQLRPADVAALGALPALRTLIAPKAGITALPDDFAAASPLEVLDLRENPLTALPAALGARPLRVLRLGGTALTDLESFSPPTDVEHLDLAIPTLARAPSWLGRLTKLRRLELAGPLDPEDALAAVAGLPSLRELVIRDVRRDGFPPALLGMTGLTLLHLIASDYSRGFAQLRARLPDTDILLE